MRDILVTENVVGDQVDALARAFDVERATDLWKTPDQLRRRIADFRALIVRNQTRVDADLLSAAKNLKVIARAGVGLDNVDVTTATGHGIAVVWTPGENAISVAELTIGLMLSLARMIPLADRSTRAGHWERQRFTGIELAGKTLGIVGLGRIGQLVAERARPFGMQVIAHDAFAIPDASLVPLDELLDRSDIVTVHVPKTPQTTGMFNHARFRRMKPSALFINTSRGEVVNEPDLVCALRDKTIAGAALDVRAAEPPIASALNDLDNVILTPHIAAFTIEGQKRVVASICRDVAAILNGHDALQYVNFPRPRRT